LIIEPVRQQNVRSKGRTDRMGGWWQQRQTLKMSATSEHEAALRSDLKAKLILSVTAFGEASRRFVNRTSLTPTGRIQIMRHVESFEEKTAQETLGRGQTQQTYAALMRRKKLLVDTKLYYFKKMNRLRMSFAPLIAKYIRRYEALDAATRKKVEWQHARLKDIQKHLEEPHKMHRVKGLDYLSEVAEVTEKLELHDFFRECSA
jgi:hypothetical protein